MGGFVGSHLAERLIAEPIELHGTIRRSPRRQWLESLGSQVHVHEVDLLDAEAVRHLVRAVQPDLVFHLAAQASVGQSWLDPAGTITNNVLAQLHLLRAVVELVPEARVLVLGSGDEYGHVRPDEIPIKETAPLRPDNPYALSKVTQDFMGLQFHLSHRLHCVRLRPFNHLGPRQSDHFVAAAFARQVAEIEVGLREPIIRVGNLEVVRDFTDVRDIARAYRLALQHGEPGEVYNVGSGRATMVRSMLDCYLDQSAVPITVEVDPSRLRVVDAPINLCDSTKFRARTGWEPTIRLEETLQATLDYWRAAVRQVSVVARDEGER